MSVRKGSDLSLPQRKIKEINTKEMLRHQNKKREKFSDLLSPEAQLAMKMVVRDNEASATSNLEENNCNRQKCNSVTDYCDVISTGCNGKLKYLEKHDVSKDFNSLFVNKTDIPKQTPSQKFRVTFDPCIKQSHEGKNAVKNTKTVTQLQTQSSSPYSKKEYDSVFQKHHVTHEKRHHSMNSETRSNSSLDNIVPEKLLRSSTIADIYQKSNLKIEGDITEKVDTKNEQKWRALDGGKPGITMEIVEIVNADDKQPNTVDTLAIEEIARKNAVEKCLVWMEANEAIDDVDTE